MKNIVLTCLIICMFIACKETFTPKPRGYYRIDFPAKEYQLFDSACPFTFEYPKYGSIIPDMNKNAEPCWINIGFPKYKGKIHLSYKKVTNGSGQFIEDSHRLAYNHAIKADAIEELLIEYPERKVYGIIYDIRGNTASSLQFYVTDSIRHFLRGSLYFETQPNKDSLAPVVQFFRKDVEQLINTLQWK
ncbi:MAG: gliding motility lipoprotein GldD [Bacteroidales bacterium]|nr:gliding motility lipoprotein GldD [Bacteroidales bacterium]